MILRQHVRPCRMVPTAPIQDLTSTFTTSPSSQPKKQVPKPASSLPLQNKSVSNIEFGGFFFCLFIIMKQIYKDINCLQMQESGIYRMPKQVRHVTPLEFQLCCCLDTCPISLEPPEAPKAQRYSLMSGTKQN